MRFVFFLVGSRGDVQPEITMAARLRRANHEVVVAAPENHQALVEGAGLSFVRAGSDTDAMGAEHTNGPLGALKLWQIVKAEFREQCDVVDRLCEGADVLVGGPHVFAGPAIAEYHAVPFVWAFASPVCLPTRECRCVLLNSPNLPEWLTSWQVFAGWCRLGVGPISMVNAYRKRRGMKPLSRLAEMVRCRAVILAADPVITKAPSDWEFETHTTGFCFLERGANMEALPDELERFLAGGSPPIYFGFGSASIKDPEACTRRIVDAVTRMGRRAVICSGVGGLGGIPLPASCIRIGAVSHTALFPRVAVAVHHGGVGTASEALRAKIPQVAAPSIFDQPFWGARFHAAGVAAKPITLDFTTDELVDALTRALADEQMRANIDRVAEGIRATDGAGAGAQVLERIGSERTAAAPGTQRDVAHAAP